MIIKIIILKRRRSLIVYYCFYFYSIKWLIIKCNAYINTIVETDGFEPSLCYLKGKCFNR